MISKCDDLNEEGRSGVVGGVEDIISFPHCRRQCAAAETMKDRVRGGASCQSAAILSWHKEAGGQCSRTPRWNPHTSKWPAIQKKLLSACPRARSPSGRSDGQNSKLNWGRSQEIKNLRVETASTVQVANIRAHLVKVLVMGSFIDLESRNSEPGRTSLSK